MNNIDLTDSSGTVQMDSTPTEGSGNCVTSGGVYTAILESFETNIGSAISHTYNELKTLVETSSLKPNQWYCITDYTTKNTSHWNTINIAIVEPLYVKAKQNNEFENRVYSQLYPKDIITYDFNDNILTSSGSGEWEDGVDNGGDIVISNWTTSTFDVNKVLIVDDSFYITAEDDDGEIEYTSSGLGTDFTLTDLGNGSTRITDLTGGINFAHPDYNYGEVDSTYKIADTTGRIYYREDPVKHIECSFDFRGVKYARKRIDTTTIPTWTSGNNYRYKDLVIHNNYLYRCMYDTTESPATYYWVRVASNLDKSYLWVSPWSDLSLPLDNNHMMIPVFSVWDNGSSSFVYNDNNVEYATIKSEDVVFPHINSNIRVSSVYTAEYASQLSFGGTTQNIEISRYTFNTVFDFNSSVQNITVQDGIINCVVTNGLRNTSIGKASNSVLGYITESKLGELITCDINHSNRITLGRHMSNIRLGNVNDCEIGSNARNCYFFAGYHNHIGDSCRDIYVFINEFSNNHIGDLWKGFEIKDTFSYNTIGTTVGSSSTLVLEHSWTNNTIGSNCLVSTSGNSFRGVVQGMTIGNNVDRLDFNGSASNSVIGNGCRSISCNDLMNVEIAPYCRFFEFNGNIQQCSFKSGVRNLTFLSPSVFKNNHVRSDHITFDSANATLTSNTVCDIYKTADGDARMSYMDDNDHHRLIDPTDSSEVLEYKLPLADGDNNQVLITNGSGDISWAYMVVPTTYINTDKNGIWTITKSSNNIWHSGHDDVTKLIDGANNEDTYFENNANVAGEWLEVDFGNPKQVDKMKWTQNNGSSHGTWKLQGYNGSWIDISPEFTLGGSTTTIYGTTWDGNRYQRVRLIGVSGQVSSSPWLYELNFKIDV